MQQNLRNRDRKFRLLFEEHPQPMWMLDASSQEFLDVNSAACTLYGYTREEFLQLHLSGVQEPQEARRFLEEWHSPTRPAASHWRHRTKTGRLIDVEVAMYPTHFGGRGAVLAVVMDITSRRQLEDQLRQAQKMEAVGMLTGGVAHDFNNLLTIITGYSQLMLSKLPKEDPNRHSVEQIVKAADRAGDLTRQLLVFSRRRTLQPRVLNVNELVSSLVTMLRRLIGEDIELKLALGEDVGQVHADPGQIEQILMNMAANSRDAMPKGGVLTIETSSVDVARHSGGAPDVKAGPYVVLQVNDTGAGMDESTRTRVFEPFFTTKSAGAGTGLGLFTVAGIVKQVGGGVDVDSEPGNGTRFRIYIPRVDHAAAPQIERETQEPARGRETILVVEDDDQVRALVQETLEGAGYRVLEASDPLEARLMADTYLGNIELLITDVIMPKASGRQLARGLLRHRPALKVLYMSGHTESAIHTRGVRRKEVAFLSKPFTPAQLADKVREVLEGDTNNTKSAAK